MSMSVGPQICPSLMCQAFGREVEYVVKIAVTVVRRRRKDRKVAKNHCFHTVILQRQNERR